MGERDGNDDHRDRANASTAAGKSDLPEDRRPHILIAEDNADMRSYLHSILSSRYDLELVAYGGAALAAIRAQRPDLVILDVMMPEFDGVSVLDSLRSQMLLKDLPVIILSARAGEEAELDGLTTGADDYVVKPFGARELLARVQARLEMTRIRSEAAVALRASEEAERQRRQELETALAAIPAAVLIAEDAGCSRIAANRVARRLLRLPEGANASKSAPEGDVGHFEVYSPEGKPISADQLPMRRAAALGREIESAECEIRFADGDIRHLLANALPLFDSAGKVRGSIGAFLDISERKRHEEQIKRLLHEVNHRSKNMLTLIQAVARWTTANSHEEFIERFSQRIQAMAINQDLLIRGEGRGVRLDELVQAQLAHFMDLFGARVHIGGPMLLMRPSAAQSIGMAVHELATNACQYGALSNERGRVKVFWRIKRLKKTPHEKQRYAGKPFLFLFWREIDAPPVPALTKSGFGSTVLVNLTQQSLDAIVQLNLRKAGLIWRLACPISNVDS